MADQEQLEVIFEALGLTQYLSGFVNEGFDAWETILYIQEQDFERLGVKLGHRRKLQQRIDEWRKEHQTTASTAPLGEAGDGTSHAESSRRQGHDGQRSGSGAVQKRKYRRHPKPDSNAPERPPSAYVLFSNKVRDELKGRALDFSEIAKMVGVRWQRLSQSERQPFEAKAQQSKEKYNRELLEYQKTPEFRHYQQYMDDFKKKHPQSQDATKRSKIESAKKAGTSNGHRDEPAGASPTVAARRPVARTAPSSSELEMPPARRQRIESSVSQAEAQFAAMPTPPISHHPSVDDSVISPKTIPFDESSGGLGVAGNGRKSRSLSLRDEHFHSNQLPSLPSMIPYDTLPGAPVGLTESPDPTGSVTGQFSRPVWTQHGMVSRTSGPPDGGTAVLPRDAQPAAWQQRLPLSEYSIYTAPPSASSGTISASSTTNTSVASSTLGGVMPINALLSSWSSPSLLQRNSKMSLLSSWSSPSLLQRNSKASPKALFAHSPPMAHRTTGYPSVDNPSPIKTHASWHGVPSAPGQAQQYWISPNHSASPISEPGRSSASPTTTAASQALPDRYPPPQLSGLAIETTLTDVGAGHGAGTGCHHDGMGSSQQMATTGPESEQPVSGREGLDVLLQAAAAAGELQRRTP